MKTANSELSTLRKGIDDIDNEIISLLGKRFKLTEEVGTYKAKHNLSSQDRVREQEKFQRIIQISKSQGLTPEYAVDIYRRILDIVISRHEEVKRR